MSEATNIHPIFNSILSREKKEGLLKQNGVVLWMTGLSGSGKSTLARALEFALHDLGYFTMLLDGDNLRTGVNSNLGFSEEDRKENVRRSAEVSKLFASAGIITICSLISPTEEIRDAAKEIIGEEDFKQVFIDAPFEVCAERDVKGLYKKALAGEIKNFTGLDSPFETPANPFVRIPTAEQSLEESLKQLLEAVLPIIKLTENK
ncbi:MULTISPECIES: adenylyl-sulfate kinase [Flammeovirga]|uniref:Adenylyl-sulfate kinase n=1 Tax=Flammeovirga agarivorans TaxID=2726742 RepID=A0A7X8SI32_9BACT|nr:MULTISPECIES: adenylyl-sulfate kinase [Flammeovirga]NLR90669.1 adenylyl-sulfate kinase [Flammeovirga agarivorans]